MKEILNAVSAKLKTWFTAVVNYLKSLKNDTSKLILTLILTIAVLLTCVAVVTFTVKVVGGISNIFSSDEPQKEEDREALPLKETATDEEPCATCTNGWCNLCTDGVLDCPDCEDGVCAVCNGEKSNQNKMLSLIFDNCLSCSGSGVCKTCDGEKVIDCKACTDGKCNTCVVSED